jgi:glutathione S-transferase
MLGDSFTAADVAIGYSIHMAKMFAELDPLEHADAYFERVSARPAFQEAVRRPDA